MLQVAISLALAPVLAAEMPAAEFCTDRPRAAADFQLTLGLSVRRADLPFRQMPSP